MSYKRIEQLLDGNSTGLPVPKGPVPKGNRKLPKAETACEACLAGKMKESFNKKTDKREGKKVRRLHANLSGMYLKSVRGYRYFLVVSCDVSRLVWLKLLKTKATNEVYPALAEIRAKAERSTGEKCRYFRADNGTGEFGYTFQESLTIDGVQFEPSLAFEHSLNGVIERAIGIIVATARSIMYEVKHPYPMWDYAVEHAVWLKNRAPTSALPYGTEDLFVSTSVTPYRAFTGKHPEFRNLKMYGCKAIPRQPNYTLTFNPLTRDGTWIFIGMDGETIWKVLNTDTLSIVRTTNTRFNKYTFPLITLPRIQDLQKEAIHIKESRKQKANRPNDRVKGTEQPMGNARVLQDLDQSVRITDQSGPQVATDATGLLEASETATPDNTIVVELPEVAVGSQSGDLPMDPEDPITSQGRKSAREDGQDESLAWPANDKPVESPYWLRTNPKRKTHFSDTIVKMVKALSVVKLEQEDKEPLFAILPEYQNASGTIPLTQAMRDNPQEWQAALKSELDSLMNTGTFKILKGPPPPGITPRSCKIVLKDKLHTDGTVARKKARVVLRGFEQQ